MSPQPGYRYTCRHPAAGPGGSQTGLTHSKETKLKDIDSAPFGIKLLSWIVLFAAVLDLSFATLLFLDRNDSNVLAETGFDSGTVAVYAIVLGLLGLFALYVGFQLRLGADFARYLIAFLAAIRVANLIYVMIFFDHSHWFGALVPAVLYALVAIYLMMDDNVKRYFQED